MVPDLLKRRVSGQLDEFCQRHRLRMSCPQMTLTYLWEDAAVILAARDGCNPPQYIARFSYSADLRQWLLFSPQDPSTWRPCMDVPPSLNFERLLSYLESDPLNLFWPPPFSCFS